MTARRITTPVRRVTDVPPSPPAAEPAELLAQAQADVRAARAVVEATRRRVAARTDGAASLSTAEYRLAGALRRLDSLGGWQPDPEPPEAA